MPSIADALTSLREHFGFDDFREGQREVIAAILEGKDTVVVMPTGSGKSLCYQLPALMLDGATLVVSPLIALMKDQVDALTASGVPATFLNSTLKANEVGARMLALRDGKYHLLYVAPERLMLPGFLANLKEWPVSLIAIDEAHGWLLMVDAGPTLKALSQTTFEVERWVATLREYAQLQQTMVDHIPDLVRLNVPDRRLGRVPEL